MPEVRMRRYESMVAKRTLNGAVGLSGFRIWARLLLIRPFFPVGPVS
jgi:hypothetical protein